MNGTEISIRPARREDVPVVARLIRDLADYERLAHECFADEAALETHVFGPRPYVEVLLAEVDGAPAGFALFFHSYSTFLTKPGLYLEDLFVVPERRGLGLGRRLLAELARLAVERGCGRLEWSVLKWNAPAIGFYERLGAVPMAEWQVYRLTAEPLRALAGKAARAAGDA
ncbi:MAG TPA: GNAT family N-acetyltransferase [Thermoanaerobaculia bacterium]|nr:GNAT family N-acetyltransferase [Thermoanaerobaculia bacterium]HPA51378.1 GNAT family N-acetyltransferase [Thermoanaerobaculia bacterium]HQN07632.1 GNAT family N-acetyltransferase [Thermoanaerobaculia bacterium]HQP84658.1 GNAT family N-acetyltransferase [Thermoanaerobaculia bacterium]